MLNLNTKNDEQLIINLKRIICDFPNHQPRRFKSAKEVYSQKTFCPNSAPLPIDTMMYHLDAYNHRNDEDFSTFGGIGEMK